MADDDTRQAAREWWIGLAPEVQRVWVRTVTGWTLDAIVREGYARSMPVPVRPEAAPAPEGQPAPLGSRQAGEGGRLVIATPPGCVID